MDLLLGFLQAVWVGKCLMMVLQWASMAFGLRPRRTMEFTL